MKKTNLNLQNLGRHIDHTLLKPDATGEQVDQLCREAQQYEFATVCLNPFWVKRATRHLSQASSQVCTVVGFPLGAHLTKCKVYEAQSAIENGAREIDMVLNLADLKAKNHENILADIDAVVRAVAPYLVKVIIETCLLTREEKILATKWSSQARAAFIKTSTGFSSGGAELEDVKLIREHLDPQVRIKASGGIRDLQTAIDMLEAGADRLGTSSGVQILSELNEKNP